MILPESGDESKRFAEPRRHTSIRLNLHAESVRWRRCGVSVTEERGTLQHAELALQHAENACPARGSLAIHYGAPG
jgi:hypothetical protein